MEYKRKKRLAFTLIEILVALSMMVLILAAVYGSYTVATTAVACCKPRSIMGQQARLFLQRITCELRCSYAGRPDEFNKRPTEGLTEEETIEREKMPFFISQKVSPGQTLLQFVTTVVTSQQSYSADGLVRVSYRLDESRTKLLRDERRCLGDVEHDDDAIGENDESWRTILANLEEITFEYYDGEKWHEEWDSNKVNGLPMAVKISLIVKNEDAGTLSFISCAQITCRGNHIPLETVQRTIKSGRNLL